MRKLRNLLLALALVPVVTIGATASANVEKTAAAAYTTCTVRAYISLSGSRLHSSGNVSCDGGATSMGVNIHLQICTAELFGTCLTWADWNVSGNPAHCGGLCHGTAFWDNCDGVYATATHNHRYRTQADVKILPNCNLLTWSNEVRYP